MKKEERLGFSFRFLLVNIFVLLALGLFALLVYVWQLWKIENLKALDPMQIGLLAIALAVLIVSLVARSVASGYRKQIKKFHKALFDAQKSPEPIETKGRIKELKTIANDLNKVIEVWDKHFKHKEKELKKDIEIERQKLANLWEDLSDGVILIDTHYSVEFANQAIKEVLGDPPEGIRCFEYLENLEDPCELCQLQEAMETGKPQKIIKELRDISGQKRYFECTGAVLPDQNDNPLGGLIMLKDISRWMDMDNLLDDQTKELDELKEKLSDALEKLEAAEQKLKESDKLVTLGLLSAEIIHEITNPINFIHAGMQNTIGHIQSLLGVFEAYEKLPLMPRARAEIEQIKRATNIEQIVQDMDQVARNAVHGADRVRELVQALRTFAKPSTEVKEIDIHDPIENALTILNRMYRDRIQILRHFDETAKVRANPGQLNQIFTNLLHNSIQAIEGSGEIMIATRQLENRVMVEISDTGSGIAPDLLPKVFDPFFTTKEKGASMGLGLSIVKTIVEELGGKISIQSQVGKGSTFYIELPSQSRAPSI